MGPSHQIMLGVFRGSMAARRCAPVMVDWTSIASKVTTDSGKAALAGLRLEINEVNKSLGSSSGGDIDWAHWNSRIQTPGAVDSFKAAYDGLAVPTLADTFTAELSTQFDGAIKSAEEHAANSTTRIAELQAELAALEVSKAAIVNRTVDEELAANPALAEEIEAEIADNHW